MSGDGDGDGMTRGDVTMHLVDRVTELERRDASGELAERVEQLEAALAAEKATTWSSRAARAVNEWRVFPRLVIALYGALIYQTVQAVLADPNPDYPTAGLVGVVTGAFAPIIMRYMSGGDK